MNVVISQRNDRNKYGDSFDSLENNYINYFEKFGMNLIAIPNSTKNLTNYFKDFQIYAIILSGGNDVNPSLYGGEKREGFAISENRDKTEKRLLEIAIKKKMHVLGICRGMHFINVFFKGELINIKDEIGEKIKHVNKTHNVKILNGDAINLIGSEIKVNSYHNQGITLSKLSAKLKIFAQTDDKVVEGLYHPTLPIMGVQWHPERKSPDEGANSKIIRAFLNSELFWKK